MRFRKPDEKKLFGEVIIPVKATKALPIGACALVSVLALSGCVTDADGNVLTRADGSEISIFDTDEEARAVIQRDSEERARRDAANGRPLSIASEDDGGGRVC